MNKILIACAMLVPLVGCTGIAGDGSNALEPAVSGSANGTGASASSSGSSAGSPASNGGAPAGVGTGGTNTTGGVSAVGGTSNGGTSNGGTSNGGTSNGGTSNGGTCTVDALPSGVQAMINNECITCHGAVPLTGLPALVSYANLTTPSKTDPTKTNAELALARIQSTSAPMPPAPGARASTADIAALQAFISSGYTKASCPTGTGGVTGGGGASGTGGASGFDPLNAIPTCTTMISWTGGNRGSASMNPGMACISCHSMGGEGPRFSIAGTVYPTGHEPDRCNSTVGTAGATIVIIGADGKQLTLTPNGVGNFSSNSAVKTPFQAKVTYQGRERLMLTPQTSGDCNSCHTQNGTMKAPGRITVP